MTTLLVEPSSAGPAAAGASRYGEPNVGVMIESAGAFFPMRRATSTVIDTVGWIVAIAAASGCGMADGLLTPTVMPARDALARIKERSGLTWEQLSRIMKVSPRSLHLWMDGGDLAAEHEERLYRLLETVNRLPFDAPFRNRRYLLAPRQDGSIPFDLLVEGRYDAVQWGERAGPARPEQRGSSVSPEERTLRRPPGPEVLMRAMEDPIHAETGKGRSIKKVARKK